MDDRHDQIAAAATELFAERGYAKVTVAEVAARAGISEATLTAHFPTKEDLVFDRSRELNRLVTEAIRKRRPGTAAATAIRPTLKEILARTARLSLDDQRGGLAYLAATDDELRRATLARTHEHAAAITAAIAAPSEEPTPREWAVGWSLAGVLQFVIEELGAAQLAGEEPRETSKRLRRDVDRMLVALEPLG